MIVTIASPKTGTGKTTLVSAFSGTIDNASDHNVEKDGYLARPTGGRKLPLSQTH